MKPFRQTGATVTLSGTTTSSATTIDKSGDRARIVNVGAVAVALQFKVGAVPVATMADLVVGPTSSVEIYKGGADNVAVITASSTATVYVTPGTGTA